MAYRSCKQTFELLLVKVVTGASALRALTSSAQSVHAARLGDLRHASGFDRRSWSSQGVDR